MCISKGVGDGKTGLVQGVCITCQIVGSDILTLIFPVFPYRYNLCIIPRFGIHTQSQGRGDDFVSCGGGQKC